MIEDAISDVFVLMFNFSHLHPEDEVDAILNKFKGYEDLTFELIKPEKLAKKPVFTSRLEYLEETDFPFCLPSWPIMSNKMLKALLDIHPFPHQPFPVVMEDYSGQRSNYDYSVIQLKEHYDGLDELNSIIETDKDLKWFITGIKKLVLKQPPKMGYPSIFRLYQHPGRLMVSNHTRKVLIEKGINGIDYVPIDEYTFP